MPPETEAGPEKAGKDRPTMSDISEKESIKISASSEIKPSGSKTLRSLSLCLFLRCPFRLTGVVDKMSVDERNESNVEK